MASLFYFAWVDEGTAFNPAIHNVEDEDVFSFNLSHAEGEFASLALTIKNPKVGLLGVGRSLWAWFSFFDGTTVHPKFYGRLVGVPNNIFGELVGLNFVARPVDFMAQKIALASTMRTLPHYDPIFIAEDRRLDPDTVLEGRSEVWHIDPVTHVVTTSDILEGEDGVVVLDVLGVMYEGLSVDMSRVPISRVITTVTYTWQQRAYGYTDVWIDKLVESYNDFVGSFPKVGDDIGDAWKVAEGTSIVALNPPIVIDIQQSGGIEAPDEEDLSASTTEWRGVTSYSYSEAGQKGNASTSTVVQNRVNTSVRELDDQDRLTSWSISEELQTKGFHIWKYKINLRVLFNPTRQITEVIQFEMRADLQNVVTLPADDEVTYLSFQSLSLSETIPFTDGTQDDIINPAFPIVDTRRRTFTDTPRGLQALEYVMLCSRAAIRNNSRAVKVGVQLANLTDWLEVSLRKDLSYSDDRLPGGGASGKITAFAFALDGNTGSFTREVTIECAVGKAGSWAAIAGVEGYSPGYSTPGYQMVLGGKNVVGTDLRYTVPTMVPQDDGRDFRRGFHRRDVNNVVVNELGLQKVFGEQLRDEMQALLDTDVNQFDPYTTWYAGNPRPLNPSWRSYQYTFMKKFMDTLAATDFVTSYSFVFPFLNRDFTSVYTVEVEPLKLPNMIDLGAV